MSDVIEFYRAKLAKKNGRAKVNLPALSRKDAAFMSCFQADPGHLFGSQDVVALEPSITAEFSQDPMYRYATLDGIGQRPRYDGGNVLLIDDIYLMSASTFPTTRDALRAIFESHTMPTGLSFADQWLVDPEVVKDYCKKPVRNFAKTACLGIGYGMGAKKFQKTSAENGKEITYKEAKEVINAYWELFEGLKALRDSLAWEAERKKAIVNPFGYRITPEPHKALNAYIQSSASGVLDVYCLKLFGVAPWLKFVCLIHDEVIFQCPVERIEELEVLSSQVVESLNADLCWSVPIRFGTKVSDNFAGLK